MENGRSREAESGERERSVKGHYNRLCAKALSSGDESRGAPLVTSVEEGKPYFDDAPGLFRSVGVFGMCSAQFWFFRRSEGEHRQLGSSLPTIKYVF